MHTMQKTVEEFLQHNYASISLPGITDLIQKVEAGFIALLQNPPSGTLCFASPPPEEPDDMNMGLITRRGEISPDGSRYDQKIFFHYPHGEQLELALAKHNPGFLQEHREFLIDCKTLHVLCRSFIKQFAFYFDEATQSKLSLHDQIGTHVDMLRILAYTDFREDHPLYIGTTHRDRCAVTLRLRESAPGLEFGESEQGPWTPITSKPNEYDIFASTLLQQLSEDAGKDPDIEAVWHRVVAGKKIIRLNKQIIRLAMVFFSKLPLAYRLKTKPL